MFFQVFVELILVLIADGNVSILAVYDAVVRYGRYFFEVDDIGTVDAHKLVCGKPLFQFLHAQQRHDRLLFFQEDTDVFVLAFHIDNLIHVQPDHFIISFDKQIETFFFSRCFLYGGRGRKLYFRLKLVLVQCFVGCRKKFVVTR